MTDRDRIPSEDGTPLPAPEPQRSTDDGSGGSGPGKPTKPGGG